MTTTLLDPGLDAATLADWLDAGDDVRLLDVRSPAEFEAVHISGSYNVPLDVLGEHAAEVRRHVDRVVADLTAPVAA